jgi:2-succinyl-5-enolpyruvyl-6-hydroxy-3-cyclohexene-1-carboxylate synthase
MPLIVLSADKPYDLKSFAEDGSLPLTADQAKGFGKFLFQAVVDARANPVSQVPGTLQTRTATITYTKSNLSS